MSNLSHIERNVCPDEFQDRITDAGGTNWYGEPNFRLVWGQTETFRSGGFWPGLNGEPSFRGYRDLLLGMNEACWILLQWNPPEKYVNPTYYYLQNCDLETGLQDLGEYPYKGRYEILLPLKSTSMVDNKLVVQSMTLSSLLIDLIIPVILEAQSIPKIKLLALRAEEKERADKAQISQIESSLHNAFPAFGTASRSAAYLGCNSAVQKKAEAIERHWKDAVRVLKQRGKGLSIGDIK